MAVEVFGNLPNTTVTSGGTTAPASGTVETWTVASSSSFPAVSSSGTPPTQLHVADIAANSEVVAVTNISGTTWTVTRGAEGTTPVTHAAGFTVYQVVSAGAYTQLRSTDWLNAVTMFGADPTGVADSTTAIQNAIDAVPGSGGVVYFPAGVYLVSGTLIVDQSYVTLQGAGYGFATTIVVPSSAVSRTAQIIIGNTAPVFQCSVRDLAIKSDGGSGAVKAGTGHGIVIAGDNCLVENVIVRYCSGDAFHFGQDLLNTATQTSIASGSNGQALPQSTIDVAATTGFASSGELIIRKTSGACAYVSYTGTSGGNQFTGCSSSFAGSSFTMATGDVVIPVGNQFDTTVINTYAMQYGGNGYYSDWTYYSCEWLDARAQGAASKPGSTTGQNGFLIYGGTQKFTMCHAYFCAGNGLQIGDAHSFTAQNIAVTGGEWESNTSSGILVTNNQGAVVIGSGAAFYGNGLSSTGQDIFLGGTAVNVRIDHCMFIKTTATSVAQNIYAFSSTYCTISGCVFTGSGVSWSVKNILLDGASGAVSNFQIRDNRMRDTNSSAVGVQVKGAVTGCVISGNITDADITEVISGSTPTGNSYWDNTFIAGQGGALTTTGANSSPAIINTWQPVDMGLIAWNFDPLGGVAASTSAVNGTIYMLRFVLRQSQVITSGGFFISAGATSATASQNFIALVDSSGAIQASTAAGAIDTATQSGQWLSQAFSSPYVAPAGTYYLAILTNAGTPLKFGAASLQGSLGTEAGVTTASAFRYAVNGTLATALPGSFTLSSNTHSGGIAVCVGVS